MKFRHSFSIYIDNFAVTYKQLLYRILVSLIALGLYVAILTPFVNALTGSPDYVSLTNGIKDFLKNLVEGRPTELGIATHQIKTAFEALLRLVAENRGNIVLGVIGVLGVNLVSKFFSGLGNYATASVINDKMALHAESPFMATLVKHLKKAAQYSIMYVPISMAYDLACIFGFYYLVFRLFAMLPFISLPIQVFLFMSVVVLAISVKMMFTSDWLPSLIRGKMKPTQAFAYSFNRRRKNSFNVLSNFFVMVILIFALNVAAVLCTVGVGLLLTIPSSYVILLCFEFVNYYEREELKYFIDKKTIIKPEKERPLTREEFFRGE